MKRKTVRPRNARPPYALALAVIQALGACAATIAAMPSLAQTAETSERIEITGSRVKRADIEGALPVTVIERQELEASGQTTVAEYIRGITFATAGNPRPSSGSFQQAFSGVNLRGLGTRRTLVLVDGRRIAKSPNVGDAVDMNSIPMAAVERIEILTDGASAIYGSDAIGGVVNIILRKSFEGVAVMLGETRVSGPKEGGDRREASAILGITGEQGRVILGAAMTHRDIIFDRHGYGTAELVGASDISNNYFRESGAFIAPVPGGCTNPNFYLAFGRCRYDFFRASASEAELDTRSFFARGEFNITRDWTAFMTSSVTRVASFGRYAPVPGYLLIEPDSVAHPWHPAYPDTSLRTMVGPNETIFLGHRFAAGGNRDTFTENNLYDTLLGVKGTLLGADIELGVRKSTSKYADVGHGYVIEALVRAEIDAGRYNIFDPISTPANVLAAFTASNGRDSLFDHTEQYAHATFDVFRLPGGMSRLFVGAERREEIYEDLIDSLSEAGVVLGSGGTSAVGSRKVTAYGAELVMPFTRRLEATIAGRRENYSDYGSDFSPKASIRFQPTSNIVVRASIGEGFSAPTLPQLTQKPTYGVGAVIDERHCLASGFTPELCATGPVLQIQILNISNPEITSEKAKQWSLGGVWDVTPTFSVTADLWQTRLDNVIVFINGREVLARDSGLSPLPIPPGLSITRDPATGEILQIVVGSTNEGVREQRGLDASIHFAANLGKFGSLRHKLIWSHVLQAESNGIPFDGSHGFPKSRAQLGNSWRFGSFDVAWNINMIGRHGDGLTLVGSYVTHDVQFGWVTPLKGLKLVVGAVNVTEEMPQLHNGFNFALYDGYGRQAYARLEMKF